MGKPWENGGLMGFNGIYPLVMIFHQDFNGDFLKIMEIFHGIINGIY